MGLPRHDGEVEGVVMEDDAVLVLGVRGHARHAKAHSTSVAAHAMLKRVSENDEATIVLMSASRLAVAT